MKQVDNAINAFLGDVLRIEAYGASWGINPVAQITLPDCLPHSIPVPFCPTTPAPVDHEYPDRWIWIVLLNPDAPDLSAPLLDKGYYFSGNYDEVINNDITVARMGLKETPGVPGKKGVLNPLVLICGEFGSPGEPPLSLPLQLTSLLTECNFDLAANLYKLLTIVGIRNQAAAAVVTAGVPAARTLYRTSAAVQVFSNTLTLADSLGELISS